MEQFICNLEEEARSEGKLCAVQVSVNDSTAMLITVGGSESYTLFCMEGEKPPIVSALSLSDDNRLLKFDFMGESSQMERRYWVPIEEALEALRYYLLTGMRSERLNWK